MERSGGGRETDSDFSTDGLVKANMLSNAFHSVIHEDPIWLQNV